MSRKKKSAAPTRTRVRRVLRVVEAAKSEGVRTAEVARAVKVDWPTTRMFLACLQEAGLVHRDDSAEIPVWVPWIPPYGRIAEALEAAVNAAEIEVRRAKVAKRARHLTTLGVTSLTE